MQALPDITTPELRALRQAFVERGFDLRLVGGCVRDLLRGETPKDIDLCTDATPAEQKAVYDALKVTCYATGLEHGTYTVNLRSGGLYEITSLRTETNHDGRHAEVAWTRDWTVDLGRRDLTFNAMAMTFDGALIDPFGGAHDLAAGVVRFVGDTGQRMQEDYLRILRFFRFHARYGSAASGFDHGLLEALPRHAGGLRTISKERVWLEMAKIISGPRGPVMIDMMQHLGVADPIGLPWGSNMRLATAWANSRDPAALMAAYLGERADYTLATWRASTAERQLARFIAEHNNCPLSQDKAKYLLAIGGATLPQVRELALVQGDLMLADFLSLWKVPTFPVTGFDLMKAGLAQGPALGEAIARLKQVWADSDYRLDKEALLVPQVCA